MRMLSPTLFWYIFKDLLKVFLLANGALAGILSFGGLLRPLTEQGLEAWQVGLLLTYFTPAMTAYSLPIAALFATTVVYGRLSADNEILACRAGGLSHLSLALPASILGLLVALISALLLLFIVPVYTLKVERVVYSNLAKIIANDIERKHQIRLPGMNLTVFARSAYIPPQPATKTGTFHQQVVLLNPTIVTFDTPHAHELTELRTRHQALKRPLTNQEEAELLAVTRKSRLQVPKDFHTASKATIFLTQANASEKIQLTVKLDDGSKFPHTLTSAQLGGVGSAQAGPFDLPSPISENTKFMDLWQLRRLHGNLTGSTKIKGLLDGFIRYDQQFEFLHRSVRDRLNAQDRRVTFDVFGKESITIERLDGAPAAVERGGDVVVASGADPKDPARRVRMAINRPNQPPTIYEAREAVVTARPVREEQRIAARVELRDLQAHNLEGSTPPRKSFAYDFSVPMPADVRAVERRPVTDYVVDPNTPREQLARMDLTPEKRRLLRELTVLTNDIVTESNSRISFALSCVILTILGCALGMMFRSGNFLTAFAVSFIPALIAITLIVAGQRVGGSVPSTFPKAENPIDLGLALIWAGNAANLLLAGALWWRLQRQ